MDSEPPSFRLAAEFLLKCITVTAVILLIVSCYRYWKYYRSFASLPSFTWKSKYFFILLTGKVPKDISFTSYIYHEVISTFKSFEEEGIFVAWLVQPFVIIISDEYTRIFATEHSAVNKASIYNILEEMLGKGLVLTNGAVWKNRRKMLNPAFRFDMLKDNVPLINEGAKIMVKKLGKHCNEPTTEIIDILKLGNLKTICRSMLGIDVNDEKYDSKLCRYLDLLRILGIYSIYRTAHPWLHWRATNLLFSTGRKHQMLYKEFHDFTSSLVTEMRNSYLSRRSDEDLETNNGGKLFADLILDAHMKDPTFTEKDLNGEVAAVIFGGHDTTAYTLLWSIYMLGVYPDIQQKAFEEAEAVIGNGSEYSYSDLSKLSYIECIIKETLRFYPTVPFNGRKTDKDIECGKYKIPKGTNVVLSPCMLHRNPKYFPDPEKFDPERFSGNNVKPWTFMPFSEGLRNCVGKNYAMMAMKIVLAHIVRNFKITSLDKREDVRYDWSLILTPEKPLRFHLTPRHSHTILHQE